MWFSMDMCVIVNEVAGCCKLYLDEIIRKIGNRE